MSEETMPIVEMGAVIEYYADCIDLDVIGTNYWTTYSRIHREGATRELVKVPLLRVGRPLVLFRPNWFARQLATLCELKLLN